MNNILSEFILEINKLPTFNGQNIDLRSESAFGDTLLHFAVASHNSKVVQLLLSSGLDINKKGEHGYTPLHEAVEAECWDIVEILTHEGASKLITNDDGLTPDELASIMYGSTIDQLISTKTFIEQTKEMRNMEGK